MAAKKTIDMQAGMPPVAVDIPDNIPAWFRKDNANLNSVYFTFPPEFLEQFKLMERVWFHELSLEREEELSKIVSNDTAGFNCGSFFTSNHLRKPVSISGTTKDRLESQLGSQGMAAMQNSMGYANRLDTIGKAYLGWLFQQPSYQEDVIFLTEEFVNELAGKPFPQPNLNRRELELSEEASKHEKQLAKAIQDVCRRWRIIKFNAIECPILQTPRPSGNMFSEADFQGVHSPLLPDIYPIEGSGTHVEQMNMTRNLTLTGHLQGWAEISAKDNKNTTPYESLARQYQIQHLWRLLEKRYPDCLNRRRRSLIPIIAAYLGVGPSTIRRDLTSLRNSDVGILDLPFETRF